MAKQRIRVLLLACATMLVCLAMIIAGTYALFSDSTTVTNHLEAGVLDITLIRESYSSKYLNGEGLLQTRTGGEFDFSNKTTENIFGLKEGALLAPGSELTANMVISNDSDVAFDYWIEIVMGDGYDDSAFAQQLEVTVTVGNNTRVFKLNDGVVVGGESGIGLVKIGESQEFTVTIKFLNLEEDKNNFVMNQRVQFDFIVRAVQTTQVAAEVIVED